MAGGLSHVRRPDGARTTPAVGGGGGGGGSPLPVSGHSPQFVGSNPPDRKGIFGRFFLFCEVRW